MTDDTVASRIAQLYAADDGEHSREDVRWLCDALTAAERERDVARADLAAEKLSHRNAVLAYQGTYDELEQDWHRQKETITKLRLHAANYVGAMVEDQNRLATVERERDALDTQIERLANYIMAEVPGEPSRSEGAVDTAIRVMARLAALEAAARDHAETCEYADLVRDAVAALDAPEPA